MAQLIDTKRIEWKQWDSKKRKYKKKKCGSLLIKNINIIKKYSFISYLKGGLELQLIVAIDFTGSNGNPTDPASLHYMGMLYGYYMLYVIYMLYISIILCIYNI